MARTPYPECGGTNPGTAALADCLNEKAKIVSLVVFNSSFDFEAFQADTQSFEDITEWQAKIGTDIIGILNNGQGQMPSTPNPVTELDESEVLGSVSYALDALFDGVDPNFPFWNFVATKGKGVSLGIVYEGAKKLWVFQTNAGGKLFATPAQPVAQPGGNTKTDKRRMQVISNFTMSSPFYPFSYDIAEDVRPLFF